MLSMPDTTRDQPMTTAPDTDTGRIAAARIIRQCVHCGFCNATCPTYQLLGDELDGPRGRIHLIGQLLAGAPPHRRMRLHLDRCLTCRSCETTCPSGVAYGRLLEFARHEINVQQARPWPSRWARSLLARSLTNYTLFGMLLGFARLVRGLLPRAWRRNIPARVTVTVTPPPHVAAPSSSPAPCTMLALAGCVQDRLTPQTNAAAAIVLARLGITLKTESVGCCGALDLHTTTAARARVHARRLIDVWSPRLASGEVAGVVMTASGCGTTIKDYPELFADDPVYQARAVALAAHCYDLCEVVVEALEARYPQYLQYCAHYPLHHLNTDPPPTIAFHAPCSLQHGQKRRGTVEQILTGVGYRLATVAESHLCCGSAGSYSLLHPRLASRLRARKLRALLTEHPTIISTANVGCQLYLGARSPVEVKHWIELLV